MRKLKIAQANFYPGPAKTGHDNLQVWAQIYYISWNLLWWVNPFILQGMHSSNFDSYINKFYGYYP